MSLAERSPGAAMIFASSLVYAFATGQDGKVLVIMLVYAILEKFNDKFPMM